MMVSRIRKQLGTAGLVVAIVALVAALAGGAYAASSGLTGKQKKEVEKIAKKFAGKPGAAGAQGPAGANGKNGTDGKNGTNGTDGKNGTNGTNGTNGEEGSPWTDGGSLPEGATETGTWRFVSQGESLEYELLSFPIPLDPADAATMAGKFVKDGSPPDLDCPGTVVNPEAEPGFLCVYGSTSGTGGGGISWGNSGGAPFGYRQADFNNEGIGPSGTFIFWEEILAGAFAGGSFAVTAPTS